MSWAWANQNPYKRRFDQINNTIEVLKAELILNDIIMKNQLDVRVHSVYDRALLAAELHMERLEALANSSRSQLVWVQSGSNQVAANVESWNPKRRKYGEGYSNSNRTYYQDWAINNVKRKNNVKSKQPIKKPAPVKPLVSTAKATNITVKTEVTKATVAGNLSAPSQCSSAVKINTTATKCKIESSTALAKNIATVKESNSSAPAVNFTTKAKTSVVKPTASAAKASESTAKTIAPVAKTTAHVAKTTAHVAKTTAHVAKTTAPVVKTKAPTPKATVSTANKNTNLPALMQVKTEFNIGENNRIQMIPSLFSTFDKSCVKLQFAASDKIRIQSKRLRPIKKTNSFKLSTVCAKTELNNQDDLMVDDLADHL